LAAALPVNGNDFDRWKNTTRNYVGMAFGENHPNVYDFDDAVARLFSMGGVGWSVSSHAADPYVESLNRMITRIDGYIDQLRVMSEIGQQRNPAPLSADSETSKKVFIIHGHNHTLVYEIAHYLQKAGLDATILHEALNQGRTIAEKLFDHADEAGFAVVLLTADDEGSEKGASSLQLRARQNVVFEMGLFIGRLGRDKVCAVYESGVELPSDLQGILYVKYVKGGTWKHDVAKEIAGAGIEVDFTKLWSGSKKPRSGLPTDHSDLRHRAWHPARAGKARRSLDQLYLMNLPRSVTLPTGLLIRDPGVAQEPPQGRPQGRLARLSLLELLTVRRGS
jgi:predicted nucleotide-binding protein